MLLNLLRMDDIIKWFLHDRNKAQDVLRAFAKSKSRVKVPKVFIQLLFPCPEIKLYNSSPSL